MKPKCLKAVITAVFVAVGVANAGMAHAAEAMEKAVVVPATVPEIWKAVDQKSAELQKAIDGGSLANVHHQAFALRDLVAALPAKSTNLPADKQAAVKSDVKFVATLAGRLDARGDANDKGGAQAEYARLAKVLAHLRANYAK